MFPLIYIVRRTLLNNCWLNASLFEFFYIIIVCSISKIGVLLSMNYKCMLILYRNYIFLNNEKVLSSTIERFKFTLCTPQMDGQMENFYNLDFKNKYFTVLLIFNFLMTYVNEEYDNLNIIGFLNKLFEVLLILKSELLFQSGSIVDLQT